MLYAPDDVGIPAHGRDSDSKNVPGRSADRTARVMLSELHTAGGQTVDIRSADFLPAVTAEFSVTEIIGQDIDDVRSPGFLAAVDTGLSEGEGSGTQTHGFHEIAPID